MTASGGGPEELVRGVLEGSARAIGRAISEVERDAVSVPEIQRRIFPRTGRARILGITGPPGAGKSTLVQRLAQAYRKAGRRVGIVAVDPSSPFTGGAILGDRIRMAEIYTDPDVFIRSMATRGALGGLARATSDAVDVLDAAGFDPIFIETVGVGQAEVEVASAADTTVVLVVPGMGDSVQAAKAGVLEVADVLVVNKADRPDTQATVRDLRAMVALATADWKPPIVTTVATAGEGIDELVRQLDRHWTWLADSGERDRRRLARARDEVAALAFGAVRDRLRVPDELAARVADGSCSPHEAAEEVLASALGA